MDLNYPEHYRPTVIKSLLLFPKFFKYDIISMNLKLYIQDEQEEISYVFKTVG